MPSRRRVPTRCARRCEHARAPLAQPRRGSATASASRPRARPAGAASCRRAARLRPGRPIAAARLGPPCRPARRARGRAPRRSPAASLSARIAGSPRRAGRRANPASASARAARSLSLWAASGIIGGSPGIASARPGSAAAARTSPDRRRAARRAGELCGEPPRPRRSSCAGRGEAGGQHRRAGAPAPRPRCACSSCGRARGASASTSGLELPDHQRRVPGCSTASFSAAISSSVSPSQSVWSSPTDGERGRRERMTFVASSRPPRPASITPTSTRALGERDERRGGRRLELGDRSPSASVRPRPRRSPGRRARPPRPKRIRRDLGAARSGCARSSAPDVRREAGADRAGRSPPAAPRSCVVTEDFPFVPTTCSDANRFCGSPSAEQRACASARGRSLQPTGSRPAR